MQIRPEKVGSTQKLVVGDGELWIGPGVSYWTSQEEALEHILRHHESVHKSYKRPAARGAVYARESIERIREELRILDENGGTES
jgi:hypothetical protein